MNAFDMIDAWLNDDPTVSDAGGTPPAAGSLGSLGRVLGARVAAGSAPQAGPQAGGQAGGQPASAQAGGVSNQRVQQLQPSQAPTQPTTPAAKPAKTPKLPFLPEGANDGLNRLGAAPTPGGVMPLVFALLVFLFAIVPVGPQGETRLFLTWKAIWGALFVPPTAADLTDGVGPLTASGVQDSLQAITAGAQQAAGQAASQAGSRFVSGAASAVAGDAGVVGSEAWWVLQGVATGGQFPSTAPAV